MFPLGIQVTNCSSGARDEGALQHKGASLQNLLRRISRPSGSILCLGGQAATGFFILRVGSAKELLISPEGQTTILRVLGPNDVIGLPEILLGQPYETTVEAVGAVQADFAPAGEFLRRLGTDGALGLWTTRQLSQSCSNAYQEIRRLVLDDRTLSDVVIRAS